MFYRGDIHHVHVPCTRRCDSPHAWTKSAVRLTWHSHYLEPGKTNSFIKKTSFQSGIVKTQAPPLLYSTHSLHINRKPSSQVRTFCKTCLQRTTAGKQSAGERNLDCRACASLLAPAIRNCNSKHTGDLSLTCCMCMWCRSPYHMTWLQHSLMHWVNLKSKRRRLKNTGVQSTHKARSEFSFKALPLRPLFFLSKEKVSSLHFESLD